MTDGEVCACPQYAQICGCFRHSHPVGATTANGELIHWRGTHWSSKCAERERALAHLTPLADRQASEDIAAIVELAVEMFRAWEEWDWYTDPANRILYWTYRDHLESYVRHYRVTHLGEEVTQVPVRTAVADDPAFVEKMGSTDPRNPERVLAPGSSQLPIPASGVRDAPAWRSGDHAEQIVGFLAQGRKNNRGGS